MLLVGQGSVGKTSLVKRLLKNEFDPKENKTEGIGIAPWEIEIKGEKIQLNIWDFGGQEIMHATHQFFLTKRSLYLLVLDARLGEVENRLEYWLKMIQSFGTNSPIIIVGNKIDQQPLDIDKRGLRKKYKNIKEIVSVSCQDGRGLDKLKRIIIKEVDQLEHLRDELPLSWFEVKTKLENMDKDYIPYHKYEHICQERNITKTDSKETLIRTLHRLGVVLNFRDDERLEHTNVLNPEWVTNGVYCILNDHQLMVECKGILPRNMLNRILDPQAYPPKKHMFIIGMMRKFELCFPLEGYPNQRFLIPDLLPKEEPYTGDWQDALAFQYHYRVLPSSIISRFIVRMNNLISKNTYWRSGVVIDYEGNQALVKADQEERTIAIWVSGSPSRRRSFLSTIRSQFDYIHKTISGLEVEEKVTLPNHPEIQPVDYKHLLNLEKMGKTSFVPPGLMQEVSIRELLDGITSAQEREVDRRDNQVSRISKPEEPPVPKKRYQNPWPASFFLLFAMSFVIAVLAGVSRIVSILAFPFVVVGCILVLIILLVLYLRVTNLLSDSQFQQLLTEIINKIPFLSKGNEKILSPQDKDNSAKLPSSETESSEEPQK